MKNFLSLLILSFLFVTPSRFPQKNNDFLVPSKKGNDPVVKASSRAIDSLETLINKRFLQSEKLVEKRGKIAEKHYKLTEVEVQLESSAKKVATANKEVDKEESKTNIKVERYRPKKDFKELTVQYENEDYHVVKDSTCVEYEWRSIFSSKKCKKYDYFLTVKK